MPTKPKPERKRGDPLLLDRLNRARGAYLARTGKEVEWKDLAEAAGLGLSSMTDVTSLNRKVTIADAIAFADYLGVEFAWLAAGRGPMIAGDERKAPTADQERRTMVVEGKRVERPRRDKSA